jgi:hypothetical protein
MVPDYKAFIYYGKTAVLSSAKQAVCQAKGQVSLVVKRPCEWGYYHFGAKTQSA